MYEAALAAVAHARAGRGPVLVECRTHRWRGHFEGDRQLYRPADEVEALAAHDPLVIQGDRLLSAGVAGIDTLDLIDERVADEVAEAVAFGKGSPEAAPEDALLHVYVRGGLRDDGAPAGAGTEVAR